MQKVLLHICCAVCASYCIQRLKEDGFYVEGFFYNPNIYPEDEYLRRLKEAHRVCEITSTKIIDGSYDSRFWLDECEKYKDFPEGSERCNVCYELRLKATHELSARLNFDFFTTTLTISPHKKSKVIEIVGKTISAEKFLPIDFKKKNGFSKALAFSKENGLYRQNYCGCMYSVRSV